jgi:hypothetical protein
MLNFPILFRIRVMRRSGTRVLGSYSEGRRSQMELRVSQNKSSRRN